MPIPPSDESGFLPVGVHECALHEIRERFGSFRGSSRRVELFVRLEAYSSMIQNDAQLQQAIEQIERLYRGLDSLRADILPKNPRNFAVFAEGPLDEIRKLQTEISNYIAGLDASAAA